MVTVMQFYIDDFALRMASEAVDDPMVTAGLTFVGSCRLDSRGRSVAAVRLRTEIA